MEPRGPYDVVNGGGIEGLERCERVKGLPRGRRDRQLLRSMAGQSVSLAALQERIGPLAVEEVPDAEVAIQATVAKARNPLADMMMELSVGSEQFYLLSELCRKYHIGVDMIQTTIAVAEHTTRLASGSVRVGEHTVYYVYDTNLGKPSDSDVVNAALLSNAERNMASTSDAEFPDPVLDFASDDEYDENDLEYQEAMFGY